MIYELHNRNDEEGLQAQVRKAELANTDFICAEVVPKSREELILQGFTHDLYVLLPQCIRADLCPAPVSKGYILCRDNCNNTTAEESCTVRSIVGLTRKVMEHDNINGKIFLIPGGRQIVDIIAKEGIPRAVLGVACARELPDGAAIVGNYGAQPFTVPLIFQERCYENAVEFDLYRDALSLAVEYICNSRNLSVMNAILLNVNSQGTGYD